MQELVHCNGKRRIASGRVVFMVTLGGVRVSREAHLFPVPGLVRYVIRKCSVVESARGVEVRERRVTPHILVM